MALEKIRCMKSFWIIYNCSDMAVIIKIHLGVEDIQLTLLRVNC